MNKQKIIVIILSALIILVGGFIVVRAIINVNEKPPVVVDQTQTSSSSEADMTQAPKVPLKGTFVGSDDLHWGHGSVEVINKAEGPVLSFGDDFEVVQGPDVHVYLSPNAPGEELGEFATLGPLHSTKGVQEYVLPANYESYKTVVIWCRAFSVTFATAELK